MFRTLWWSYSLYVYILAHQEIYIKSTQFLYINYTLKKLKKENSTESTLNTINMFMCIPFIIKLRIYLDIGCNHGVYWLSQKMKGLICIFFKWLLVYFNTAKFAGNWLIPVAWWEVETPLHSGGSSCFSPDSHKLRSALPPALSKAVE